MKYQLCWTFHNSKIAKNSYCKNKLHEIVSILRNRGIKFEHLFQETLPEVEEGTVQLVDFLVLISLDKLPLIFQALFTLLQNKCP
jgi:hypothetical protein